MRGFLFLICFILPLPCYANELIDMKIIAKIESNNNFLAFNFRSKAVGLYQITPICLKEFNHYNHKKYNMLSLFIPKKNYEVAYWYLNVRIPQMLRYYNKEVTINNVLISYNSGIKYAVKNLSLKKETINYIKKYNKLKEVTNG